MSTAIEYGYNYVFDLASRLSAEEQDRLVREMDASRKKPKEPVQPVRETDDSHVDYDWSLTEFRMVEYTVPGEPIISAERLEEIKRIGERRQKKRTPEELEENRQRLLEILLNCPVMSDEDLQGIIDARKEFNECRLAYL